MPQTERHARWKIPPVEEASDDDRSVVAAAERTEENILTTYMCDASGNTCKAYMYMYM